MQNEDELHVSDERGISPHKIDDVDQSIQDKLQKLKTLSTMKKVQADGGNECGSEELDKGMDYVGRVVSSKAENLPSSNSLVKGRQPLLSKRSKKQLMTLGSEERSFSQEDLSGMLDLVVVSAEFRT